MRLHKAISRLSTIFTIALLLCSCSDDEQNFLSDTGTLTPLVTVNPRIYGTKATLEDFDIATPVANAFSLTLTDEDTGLEAKWPCIDDFSTTSRYRAGKYTLSVSTPATPEGFDGVMFSGEEEAEVIANTNTQVDITARLSRAIIRANYKASALKVFRDVELKFHSSNGSEYIAYPLSETKPMFLNPGTLTAIASVTLADGRIVRFIASEREIKAATYYEFTVSGEMQDGNPVLYLETTDGKGESRTVVDEMLASSRCPQLTPEGFTPGEPLTIVEGTVPAKPVKISVSPDGSSAVKSIRLMTDCASLIASGMPRELDLLSCSMAQMATMRGLGLEFDGVTINFSKLISSINFDPADLISTFTVVASNTAGLVNDPMTLSVKVNDTELTVVSISESVVGLNEATARISSNALDLRQKLEILTLGADSRWAPTTINSIAKVGAMEYDVRFALPDDTRNVNVRITYGGRIKGEGVVKRISPVFSIEADAFARTAHIRLTAEDPSLLHAITENVTIYAGDTPLTAYNRDAKSGTLDVLGLNPATNYSLRASVMQNPYVEADFSPRIDIRTERATELPNGDFEETEKGIDYDNLPSGGVYSQTIVDIHNQQNHTSYHVLVPKSWATTNDKTFCTQARNKNTWYMQPSAMITEEAVSGNYAMKLVNTAWDIDGPEILPYTQVSTPYLHYNPNIPSIAHRAAGRMWLGSYSFNSSKCTESMEDGIKFTSRPSSLNGMYKYMPGMGSASESGLARVKVWGLVSGKEDIIAQGEARLGVTPDYMAFSIPLYYSHFGIKATRISVMLAASDRLGDIDFESSHVVTYPDPVSATSTGATLWIDNITFAY